jgi:stage V sporulation protein R
MMGIEYLWGAPVQLETSEIVKSAQESRRYGSSLPEKPEDRKNIKWKRVLYTMKDRKLTKEDLEQD